MNHTLNRRAALAMIGSTPLTLALTGASLAQAAPPAPQPRLSVAPIEPLAGTWRTWLLRSGTDIRLPAPPDSAVEVDAVRALADQRDAASIERIAFWDAGAAPYRWTEIAIDLAHVQESLGLARAARVFSYVNAAM